MTEAEAWPVVVRALSGILQGETLEKWSAAAHISAVQKRDCPAAFNGVNSGF